MSPATLVQTQLETYNDRDLAGFAATYHDNVALYNFGEDLPFLTGIMALKSVYGKIFDNSPNLHSKLLQRIVFDNKAIDHELITGRLGVASMELVAIYEVEEGLIRKVTFLRK
ncbi:MAG: nuclear transport factor 2 family protein [Bacteroidota bacterium]